MKVYKNSFVYVVFLIILVGCSNQSINSNNQSQSLSAMKEVTAELDFQDPASVAATINAISEAYSAIKSSNEEKDEQKFRTETLAALSRIESSLGRIENKLTEIALQIDQLADLNKRIFELGETKSCLSIIDVYQTNFSVWSKNPGTYRGEIENHLAELQRSRSRLAIPDLTGNRRTFAVMLTLGFTQQVEIALIRLAGHDPQRISLVKNSYLQYYKQAKDESILGSLAATLAQLRNDLSAAEKNTPTYARQPFDFVEQYWRTEEIDGPRAPRTTYTTWKLVTRLLVTGDRERGYFVENEAECWFILSDNEISKSRGPQSREQADRRQDQSRLHKLNELNSRKESYQNALNLHNEYREHVEIIDKLFSP